MVALVEGSSAAGGSIGYRRVCLAADPKSVRSGNGGVANCAALPTANAGQYATSHCKPLLFWFPCKWLYINVRTPDL